MGNTSKFNYKLPILVRLKINKILCYLNKKGDSTDVCRDRDASEGVHRGYRTTTQFEK